jgi:drug/metabolite transporter (DMT)-like permease
MSLLAIVLVLISALMHAAWNFIAKSKAPSAAFFAIATIASTIAMLPVFIYYAPQIPLLPADVWMILLATSFCHALYFVSLANAYRLQDISYVYPLARALPVLFVPIVCFVIGYGKPLSPWAILGMIITAAGCLVLPVRALDFSFFKHYLHRSLLFILLTALATAGYSILDSIGLEKLQHTTSHFSAIDTTLLFSAFQNLLMIVFLVPYVFSVRSERHHLQTVLRHSWGFPAIAGIICTAAYGLIMLAMQFVANVSYVVAFRQTSILFGFLFGVFLLKEKTTVYKLSGVILIFIGLVLAAVG